MVPVQRRNTCGTVFHLYIETSLPASKSTLNVHLNQSRSFFLSSREVFQHTLDYLFFLVQRGEGKGGKVSKPRACVDTLFLLCNIPKNVPRTILFLEQSPRSMTYHETVQLEYSQILFVIHFLFDESGEKKE